MTPLLMMAPPEPLVATLPMIWQLLKESVLELLIAAPLFVV